MPDRRSRLTASLESKRARLDRAQAELARARSALKALDRKRQTRWKIVLGGAVLAEAAADPAFRQQLDALLDRRVTAERDLPLLAEWRGRPTPPQREAPPGALVGFRPAKLPGGGWGSVLDGPRADALPAELAGCQIVVTDRSKRSWTAEVLEIVQREKGRLLVRDTGRPHASP